MHVGLTSEKNTAIVKMIIVWFALPMLISGFGFVNVGTNFDILQYVSRNVTVRTVKNSHHMEISKGKNFIEQRIDVCDRFCNPKMIDNYTQSG